MAYVKFYSDLLILEIDQILWMRKKLNFHQIWIMIENQ